MKKLNADTAAILKAIDDASRATSAVADTVSRELATHTQQDDERFDRLTQIVESIATDTQSLLQSRSFSKGVWKAVSILSVGISTIVGLVIAYLTK